MKSMRFVRIGYSTILLITSGLFAQSDEGVSSEEVIELSPFSVSTEAESAYRAEATLAGTRIRSNLVDPRSALTPPPVGVTVLKRANAVAIQFVLSHTGDKQDVRNRELYASLEAVETALGNVSGIKLEQREVHFTGGDKKLFSSSRGGSTASFVSILVLSDLSPESRVADRVKQVRDLLGATKLVGSTKYSDGSVGLYLKNPDQYRREILQKIFEDVDFLKKGFNGEYEVQPNGLNGKVRMRVSGEGEIELWIDYGIQFRSIRELEALGKK